MKTVNVVIPAYNEEERIVATLQAVKSIAGIDKIIVVNDGSKDATSEQARSQGVQVLDLSSNRGGKGGGAMNAALPYLDADIIVFFRC